MKVDSLTSLVATTTFVSSALADFHVGTVAGLGLPNGASFSLRAVASNHFSDCKAWIASSKGANGYTGHDDKGVPDFFSIFAYGKQFCANDKLDFYKDQHSNIWTGFHSGGDGSVVATCYPGNHFYSGPTGDSDLSCEVGWLGASTKWNVYDQLICYSAICT